MNYRVLSIDAWRHDGSWTWNNWHKVGDVDANAFSEGTTDRAIIMRLRKAGFLGPYSKGRVCVDDDGANIVILLRGTREPLLAIEYDTGEL